MRIIDRLTKAIRRAAVHNPDVQVAPACILWPDGDRINDYHLSLYERRAAREAEE